MKHDFLKNEISKIIFNDLSLRDYVVTIISEATGLDFNFVKENLILDNSNINSNANIKNSEVDAIYKNDYMYFNIEINTNKSMISDGKNMRYICHLLLKQVPPGEIDRYRKVWQINLNDYDYFGLGEFMYQSNIIEEKYHIKREDFMTIVDINIALLRKLDYNLIRSERKDSLKRLLYIFICKDKDRRKELYEGDSLMEKVNSKLEYLTDEFGNLYYDREEFKKAENYELGTKYGILISKKEIAKNLLTMGLKEDDIVKATGLTKEELDALNINN